MKKSILFLLALFSVTMTTQATDYYYRGEKNSWGDGQKLEVSTDTYYSYIHFDAGAEHQFKICEHATDWDQPNYGKTYNDVGFNGTDVTELGDHWGGDNCKIWSSKAHYILVYHPNTKINTTSKVKICASTFLPDDSNTDLPEPEPEPTELTYNVTVPAGTNVCYICGNMTSWKFTEMTKVDDTHYTITIEGAKKDDGYKYASGSDWGYVEKDANGNEIGDRTYVDGNDVVAKWAAVYEPDAVEQELTYSVTVPEGTHTCYIAMDTDPESDGWEFTEMTKVDDTHYTFVRTGLKNKTYKYASGPSWDYVEKTSENGDVADRQWAENDVVAKWNDVYNPTPTYTVTVSDNTGGFEPLTTGGGEYEEGENATVTASEEVEGWVFVGWMANEEFVANDPTYTFAVEGNTELVAVYAMVMEEEITNLVIDTDWMVLIGGPSTNLQVEVFLGLGEDDGEGGFLLSDESSVSIMGQDATWIDGKASVDMDAKTATAIVVVELGGTYYALSLTMSAPSAEPTNVVVVNAVATYDDNTGALTLTGIWKDAEVSVEIAGYDGKESVEYSGPQGIKFETPDVVAFGNEAEITVAGEDITVVCTASSFHSGDVFNVTITTLSAVGTALDNVTTTVAPAKAIVNGQLVIVKDGVKYNAQGTVVK